MASQKDILIDHSEQLLTALEEGDHEFAKDLATDIYIRTQNAGKAFKD